MRIRFLLFGFLLLCSAICSSIAFDDPPTPEFACDFWPIPLVPNPCSNQNNQTCPTGCATSQNSNAPAGYCTNPERLYSNYVIYGRTDCPVFGEVDGGVVADPCYAQRNCERGFTLGSICTNGDCTLYNPVNMHKSCWTCSAGGATTNVTAFSYFTMPCPE